MNDFEELRNLLKVSKAFLRNKDYGNAWKTLNIQTHLANTFNSDSSILIQINFCKLRSRILKKENKFNELLFQEFKQYLLLILNEICLYPFGSQYTWYRDNCKASDSYLNNNKNITIALKSLNLYENRENIFNEINEFAFSELAMIYGIENPLLEIDPSNMEPMEFVEMNKRLEKIKGKQIDVEIYKINQIITSTLSVK